MDEEDRTGVEDLLCWAFEYRGQRRDSRDTCVEVSLEEMEVDPETLSPPE